VAHFCAKGKPLCTCASAGGTGNIELFLTAALLCWPPAPLAPGALNGKDHSRVIYQPNQVLFAIQ
jgi:hypothetical protein